MAVLPLVEDIEGEGDATVDHEPWAASHPDGRDQADAMGPSFVGVNDVDLVPAEVLPQLRDGSRVPWAPKWQLEKWDAAVGTGRLEITARTAPDPYVMSPTGEISGRRQHLHHRPGVQSGFVDQVEDTELSRHDRSIGVGGERRSCRVMFKRSKISITEGWGNLRNMLT